MNLEVEFSKLYNTMLLIETKGESTKIMADCLRYVEQLHESVTKSVTKANEAKGEDI